MEGSVADRQATDEGILAAARAYARCHNLRTEARRMILLAIFLNRDDEQIIDAAKYLIKIDEELQHAYLVLRSQVKGVQDGERS